MTSKEFILSTIKTHEPKLREWGVIQIGLFGSYVRGEQTEKSDIDILIDFVPEQENFDNFMNVCFYFDELFKKEKVEIVTKNGLSPYIGPKILKEVVYV